ncbi:DUF3320 domain-containing protein [Nakamurella deserti]|uniref:DUF3320 domain-containing protein n=1 Tax=Nakamurella deserti TaxID=2164074 RepID=UPI000DBE1F7B|nr:DUF3320 domain-containing protein [Nakamurella deserti]
MTAQTELTASLEDKLNRQLEQWRRSLIALDRRQRLLYFKHTKSSSFEVVAPGPVEIASDLNGGSVLLAARQAGLAADDEGYDGLHALVSDKTPVEVERGLKRLDTVSKQVYADRGLWTLNLGLGMLEWIDPDDGKPALAPLVLLPVELSRAGVGQPYELSRTEDEPMFNAALRHKLDALGIDLPDIDIDDVDVDGIMRSLATAILDRPGWSVLGRTVLTTFTFHKEAMFRDLGENLATVAAHPMVQLLALGPDSPSAHSLSFDPVDESTLDETFPPEQLVSILDADGSQRRCILAVKAGQSFVMDGPPGTGKSQTIANMVVELMADGKTVLFVSEKAAALDVVRNRIGGAGLDNFLLELHSHAATRKHVVEELHAALTQQVRVSHRFGESDVQTLTEARRQLTQYANAMNETRKPFNRTMFWALGRIAELDAPVRVTPLRSPQHAQLTGGQLAEVLEHARRLGSAWRPVVEGDDFLWAGLAADDLDNADAQRMSSAAAEAGRAADALISRIHAVDEDLGVAMSMSEPDIRRRLQLLDLASRNPNPPDMWLTAPEIAHLLPLIAARESTVGDLLGARGRLEASVGDRWPDVEHERLADLDTLSRASWKPELTLKATEVGHQAGFLEAAAPWLRAMSQDAARLARLLGMREARIDAASAMTYAKLAGLGSAPQRPEAEWLNPAVYQAVQESMTVLAPLVELVRRRDEAMREVFSAQALDLELSTLHIRFRDTYKGFAKFSGPARADRKALKEVTISGKLDKGVLAHLGEAAEWQKAHRELATREQRFAPALGPRYERLDTDFARIAGAVEVAEKAVRLAGADLDSARLAGQLAAGAVPDPSLVPLSMKLSAGLSQWEEQSAANLGVTARLALRNLTLDEAASWCEQQRAALVAPLQAIEHVAVLAGRDVTVDEARTVLLTAREVQIAATTLESTRDVDESTFGALWGGTDTDWSVVRSALSWSEQVRTALSGPVAPTVAQNFGTVAMTPVQLASRINDWERARTAILNDFAVERQRELRIEVSADLEAAAVLMSDMAATGVGDIDEWCRFQHERTWFTSHGLADVLDAVQQARTDKDVLSACFETAMLQAWADETIRTDDRLTQYRSKERDALVTHFRDLDRQLVQDSYSVVAERCSARRPRSLRSRAAQVIAREAQKKTRHKPIRALLSETAELVQELKPCFMMSPLSVSQYLPADLRFDVVIFDEASQVLPADAINCVYRGQQLVVAGDQKQLPPTDFFASGEDEDEDTDLDSFQSVLDLAKGAGALTSLPLSWHYRSQHEDLITYSNYRFYDGKLSTFPGAVFDAPDLGVELIVVNGQYRRGGARDNPVEAAKVAERVAHHLHEHPELSLGVVTFSAAQEDCVRAALEQRADTDPALRGLLGDHDRLDGFFVKSLENVQGDERDVIFFSIGYGPDEFGKMTMNFGPLNREGGWKRLNVAITRARRRVEVVSSFRASQMTETQSEGIRHLRGYLDFAERGMAALSTDSVESLGDAESPFEEQVLQVIRSWGYDAVSQVGAAGYRIDIAIRHPDRHGSFVLAVECDGAAYHSAKTARDRDRLREAVLVGLGWTVHRIWGISWWRDRVVQETQLRSAIEQAVAASDGDALPALVPMRSSTVEFEVVDFDARPDWALPYVAADIEADFLYDPKTPDALPSLRRYFGKVLAVEAPIHESLIYARFNDDWGVGRMGSLIRGNVDRALAKVVIDGQSVVRDDFGFYRVRDARAAAVRVPADHGTVRKVIQVPPEELELAALNVIRDAVLADREATLQAVARLFGWRRVGADIHSAIESAISRLVGQGSVESVRNQGLRIADA